jgi:hypothetical protein
MEEIEKLYRNAGFQKKQCKDYSCTVCEKYNECETYPSFSEKKQLDLIKLLCGLKDFTFEAEIFKGVYYVGCREAGSNNKHWGSHNVFKEALAELINELWQSLTEEEKQQVKGILE